MAGEDFTQNLRQIIRRIGNKRLPACLLGNLSKSGLVQLAVRVKTDGIDGNSALLRIGKRLIQLLIGLLLGSSGSLVEIVIPVSQQDDHGFVGRIGAILQHLDGFFDPNGNVRVGTPVKPINELLQVLFIRSGLNFQQCLLPLNAVRIGDNPYFISLDREHIDEHLHRFITDFVPVTLIHRVAVVHDQNGIDL
ncbi:hypothetical protein D3C81_1076520 [compost metagenome]